jgi:hypothetical protein
LHFCRARLEDNWARKPQVQDVGERDIEVDAPGAKARIPRCRETAKTA